MSNPDQTCIICRYNGNVFTMYHSDVDGNDYPICPQCQVEAPPALITRAIQNFIYEQRRRGINF
jgi:hypothetical protein